MDSVCLLRHTSPSCVPGRMNLSGLAMSCVKLPSHQSLRHFVYLPLCPTKNVVNHMLCRMVERKTCGSLTYGETHYSARLRTSRHNSDLSSKCSFVSFYSLKIDGRRLPFRATFCSSLRVQAAEVEVLVNTESLNQQLLADIKLLKEPYNRPFYLRNCHVETIFAAYYRKLPMVEYRRECLRMSDGGTVALDWPIGGDDPNLWSSPVAEEAPVLIFLPGLTGGSGDTYVRHMVLKARRAGWHTVVFNSRGCAKSPVTTPQFYSASFTEDLRQVAKYVAQKFQKNNIYAIGWSLGANILVRYLAQEGENCILAGALSLCNPFDLVLADKCFHVGFNNVYDKSLASALKKIFKRHSKLFEGIGGEYDIAKASNPKSVRDFDEGLTRVSFGFKTVDEYYYKSSSSRSIKDVRIPLLCIQAEDDPIAPSAGIPRADIKANKHCALVLTPGGGHLGWVAGAEAPFGAPWPDKLVMEYLISLDRYVTSVSGVGGKSIQNLNAVVVSASAVGSQVGIPDPEEAVIR